MSEHKLVKRSQKETLENNFHKHWVLLYGNLPEPVRQHPVRNPVTNRDFRLDFAFVPEKLAIEIQGGSYVRGGHNTAKGQARDYIKHNYLTSQGWMVLYFSTPMLKDMASAVDFVAELLCNASDID